jgi:hypothetical protein
MTLKEQFEIETGLNSGDIKFDKHIRDRYIQWLEKRSRESDRKIGMLQRSVDFYEGKDRKRNSWLYKAKLQAGYDAGVSFDRVWSETLDRAKKTEIFKKNTQTND